MKWPDLTMPPAAQSSPWWLKLLWMVAIWASSIALLTVAAYALRIVLIR